MFTAFEQMITGRSGHRILLLKGVSNRGKTVVLSELLAYSRHLGLPATLLDLKGCPSLDDLFQTMRLDLRPGTLRRACLANGTARLYELISDLQQLSQPLLLAFDTYEHVSAEVSKWLESQLLPRIGQAPVIVVIGGQQVPPMEKQTWRRFAQSRELEPILQADEWLEYTQRRWRGSQVKRDQIDFLTMATNGNPGELSALLETAMPKVQKNRSC